MVMAVSVIVAVIMPVVMSAVGTMHVWCGGRLGMAVVAVLFMVAICMAAVMMTRVRGRTVGAALGFKSFLYRVHDQVHGTQ